MRSRSALHSSGTVAFHSAALEQVAVEEESNEILAVRDLLKAFAILAGAVITIEQCTRRVTPRRSPSALISSEHS
jgi:hypothetical protein